MGVLAECPSCRIKMSVKRKVCSCGEDMDRAKGSKRVRYWVDYFLPDGKARREPVGFSIRDAQDAFSKRRVQKREGKFFEMLPEANITFEELTKWYLNLAKVQAKARYHGGQTQSMIKQFNKEFGKWPIRSLKPIDLENYQIKMKDAGKRDATVDSHIGAAITMLNRAIANDVIDANFIKPFKKVDRLLRKNANARDRVWTAAEYEAICAKAAPHVRLTIQVAYLTGMRKSEILGLTWDRVHLNHEFPHIHLRAEDTKDDEPRDVPIWGSLHDILKSIRRGPHDNHLILYHDNHVVLYNGKPVKDIRTGLTTACDEADVPYGRNVPNGLTFHDLRHTFNTNAHRAGVSKAVIMEITGHATEDMSHRYRTVDQEETRSGMARFQEFIKGQNLDQTTDQAGNI